MTFHVKPFLIMLILTGILHVADSQSVRGCLPTEQQTGTYDPGYGISPTVPGVFPEDSTVHAARGWSFAI